MAWELPNQPNGGLNTTGLAAITTEITEDHLRPGDILLNLTGGGNVNDIHVVIFAGWTNAQGDPASQPTQPVSYYDALEDQYGTYINGKTIIGTLETRNMPYPYWSVSDGNTRDYVPRRLDPSKVQGGAAVTLPSSSNRPGGLWISPKSGSTAQGSVHFAAWAYPTHLSDPPIQLVNFTIKLQGSWRSACIVPSQPSNAIPNPVPVPTPASIPSPTPDAQMYSCDADLSQFHIVPGQIQVSFDVYDQAGNVNLAPNGIRILSYLPAPSLQHVDWLNFTYTGLCFRSPVPITVHNGGAIGDVLKYL